MHSTAKSIYKNSEKRKFIDNISKQIEKEYGIKRSGYARWITIDGYLFNINSLLNPVENFLHIELEVKPLYVDDLLWEILGYGNTIKPFSLRITGCDAVTNVTICKLKWNIVGDEGYSESNLTSLYRQIYTTLENHINKFLKNHPCADDYYYYNNNWTNQILPILMLCHQHKYRQALSIIKEEMSKGRAGGVVFDMPDNTEKTTYQFMQDYCLSQINSKIDLIGAQDC